MRNRAVAGVVGVLLAAVSGFTACGGDEEMPDGGGEPAAERLYLGGLGEIFVVDVETERVKRLDYPALVGGDPSNLIEARRGGFALWSGSRTLFSEYDLTRPPRLIGGSRFFVAPDESNRIWLIGDPGGRPGTHGFVREVNVDGKPITSPKPPPSGYPTAAVGDGLVFEQRGGLTIWGPQGGESRVVRTGGALAGASHRESVTLCDANRGADLRVVSASTGAMESIETPPNVAGVDCRNGEISPDGSLLAAPVTISDRPLGWLAYSKAPIALGIADLRSHRLTVIPGTRVPNAYHYARWSPEGTSAFLLGRGFDGPRSGEVRNRIVEYVPKTETTREIDVDLGAFYDVVVTEATGPLPERSYSSTREAGLVR